MRHDELEDDDHNSSGGESDSGAAGGSDERGNSGGTGAGLSSGGGSLGGDDDSGDMDSKRKRRLELNRKAAKESRRRKKMRIEELGRSVVFLTRENQELREENELLRQMVAAEVPATASTDDNLALSKMQAENAALRLALYETVKSDMTKKGLDPTKVAEHHQLMKLHQNSPGPKDARHAFSLTDHSLSAPLPPLSSSSMSTSNPSAPGNISTAISLLSSLPPLPPPAGGGSSGSNSTTGNAHPGPASGAENAHQKEIMTMQRNASGDPRDNSNNGKGSPGAVLARNQGESLLDATGSGGRSLLSATPIGNYVGINMPGMANVGSTVRDRDGTLNSGSMGGRTGSGRASQPSVGLYGDGGGGRPAASTLLQRADYGERGGYGALSMRQGIQRGKVDRGVGGNALSSSAATSAGLEQHMAEFLAAGTSATATACRARSMPHGVVPRKGDGLGAASSGTNDSRGTWRPWSGGREGGTDNGGVDRGL